MTPQQISPGNVFLNALVLPLLTIIDKRWKRYCVSSGSLVTAEIHFPKSWTNSTAWIFYNPPVSTATDTNVSGRQVCVFRRFVACRCIRRCTCLDCRVVQMWYCKRVRNCDILYKLMAGHVTKGWNSLHPVFFRTLISRLVPSPLQIEQAFDCSPIIILFLLIPMHPCTWPCSVWVSQH